jgi:hypothetical protein
MDSSAVRFSPPDTLPAGALVGDVRWVLLRAFAPLELSAPAAGAGVVDLAAALGVDARLGARVPVTSLSREVGRVAAARLLQAAALVRGREETLASLLPRLAGAAAARALPMTFLKFAALHAAGRLRAGSRPAADLDVLVPPHRLDDMRAVLSDLGFSKVAGAEPDPHQIEPQMDAEQRVIEVHRWIPWLVAPGHGRATHAALLASEALVPLPGALAPATRLRDSLLAAHAIAHGVAQNGFFPDRYPFLRSLADLVDLFAAGAAEGPAVYPWLAHAVSAEEAAGCLDLARQLSAGAGAPLEAPTPAGALLRHALWGALDTRYRSALRAGYFEDLRRRLWSAPEARHALKEIVFPGAGAFQRLYGFPRHTLRGGLALATRPLQLLFRHLRGSAQPQEESRFSR